MTHGNAENAELRWWNREMMRGKDRRKGSERGLQQLGAPLSACPIFPNQVHEQHASTFLYVQDWQC
jgi:hypothetical protein